MALKYIKDLEYLIPRVVAWILLWLVALVDAVWHRQTKRRGFQLQWGIVICLFAYVVQEVLLLSYSSLNRGSNTSDDVRKAWYVFSDLADSIFMGLLLLIAAGYCITRDNLGPYTAKVLATPATYFVTKVLTDIILDIYEGPDVTEVDISVFDPWTWFVLYIAQVVSLMAFMLALVFIFEIVQKEVEALTRPKEGIVGAQDSELGPSASDAPQAQGHSVALPPQATENGRPLNDVYAEVTVEDHDAPKTVEEKLQHRRKVQLMRQFSWAAAICVACYVVALVLPLFYYNKPGEEDMAVRVVLILWNCVLWLFLAGLCFIFRVRETNPYLLLDEEAGGLDTDFSSGEVHTELGVLSSVSDKALEEAEAVNRNFSIGDEEDEEEVAKGRARLMSRNREKSSID